MTNQELDNIIKNLKTIPDGNDELARTILKAAANSITLDKIKALTANVASVEDKTEQIESMNGSEILVFSQKEINSMPRTFRKQFRCKGITAHVHKRRSGKKNWNYEIRCQINKMKVNVSSNNLEEAKQKFIKRLYEVETYGDTKAPSIPTTFDGFSEYFFENFYKRKVKVETLRVGLNQYKNHLKPHFGSIPIRRITPKICQDLLDRLDLEANELLTMSEDKIFQILISELKVRNLGQRCMIEISNCLYNLCQEFNA